MKETFRTRLLHFLNKRDSGKRRSGVKKQELRFASDYLGRDVWISLLLPPGYPGFFQKYPVLFFNDGQDLEALRLETTLNHLYAENKIEPFILAAIHTDAHRMHDYGVAGIPDYKKRGAGARKYTSFVLEELIPFLFENYRITAPGEGYAFAGCSLGGLSAFDIVWNHPGFFEKAGVFSGSFWWRSRPVRHDDPDADRIAHEMVYKGRYKKGLKFWLQTGTEDERDDRNHNGVIDSIDDTLDLIKALESKGYRQNEDIKYVEVIGGRHDQHTWARIMSDFLMWAFGKASGL